VPLNRDDGDKKTYRILNCRLLQRKKSQEGGRLLQVTRNNLQANGMKKKTRSLELLSNVVNCIICIFKLSETLDFSFVHMRSHLFLILVWCLRPALTSAMAIMQSGRVCVVKGANRGIGYHIAEQLKESGEFDSIILGCRNERRGLEAAKKTRLAL
jgi:hypothetical protein